MKTIDQSIDDRTLHTLKERRKVLLSEICELKKLESELKRVERAISAYEKEDATVTRPRCTGCYYAPRDSRDGTPSGGCDECRQGPQYR